MNKKKRKGNRYLKTFQRVLGLVCFLQWDMMFWSWGWSGNSQWIWELWVDIRAGDFVILQINRYNSFCIFGIGLFFALTLDLWIGITRWIVRHIRENYPMDYPAYP